MRTLWPEYKNHKSWMNKSVSARDMWHVDQNKSNDRKPASLLEMECENQYESITAADQYALIKPGHLARHCTSNERLLVINKWKAAEGSAPSQWLIHLTLAMWQWRYQREDIMDWHLCAKTGRTIYSIHLPDTLCKCAWHWLCFWQKDGYDHVNIATNYNTFKIRASKGTTCFHLGLALVVRHNADPSNTNTLLSCLVEMGI